MSVLTDVFRDGAKVVISPDKMRAWVWLPPPAKGVRYTEEAIAQWLPQNGVVFGANVQMIRGAVESKKYNDLLEVARGVMPTPAIKKNYDLKVEKKLFLGLSATRDGSLMYDNLHFLQEVHPGQVLAEIIPETPAQNGMTVTGEPILPGAAKPGRTLEGSGFVISPDGLKAVAPVLSHVGFVNDAMVVTPVKKIEDLLGNDPPCEFDGNVVVEGDLGQGAKINAGGSIYVLGNASSATLTAKNNILLSKGMRADGAFGQIEAGGNVWGLFFESCNIKAEGDICANHVGGCEINVNGRASILGGRGYIAYTNLYARMGVVAVQLGGAEGDTSLISAGMTSELIERFAGVEKSIERLNTDIQALQQNIVAHERVNRMRADKGRNNPTYQEMLKRREQSLGVYKILSEEYTKVKRSIEKYSNVSIIARNFAMKGITVGIDTRTRRITTTRERTKFYREGEYIESQATGTR